MKRINQNNYNGNKLAAETSLHDDLAGKDKTGDEDILSIERRDCKTPMSTELTVATRNQYDALTISDCDSDDNDSTQKIHEKSTRRKGSNHLNTREKEIARNDQKREDKTQREATIPREMRQSL